MTDQGWDVARVAARGAKAFWSWLGRCRGGDSEDLTEGCASLGRLKQMVGWTSDEQIGSGSLGGFVFLFVKSNLLFLTDYSWTFGFWNYPDRRILQKEKKTHTKTLSIKYENQISSHHQTKAALIYMSEYGTSRHQKKSLVSFDRHSH